MKSQCFVLCLLISSLVSVFGDSTTEGTSKSGDVKFKSGFPYDIYGGDGGNVQLYDTPMSGGYYGGALPYPQYSQYPQYASPVSYPSYSVPQQPYQPYNYNPYSTYQSYQPYPYNYYPQENTNGYVIPYQSLGRQNIGYPATTSDGTSHLLNVLRPTNVYPNVRSDNENHTVVAKTQPEDKTSTVYLTEPDRSSSQQIQPILGYYQTQESFGDYGPIYEGGYGVGYGGNYGGSYGGSYGSYPSLDQYPNVGQRYDPFANIPTEIIDVDYTPGFRTSGVASGKPQVKVTSKSYQSDYSSSPVVRTVSNVVTTKPSHTVITRIYDPSKGDEPEIKIVNVGDDETNEVPSDDKEEEEKVEDEEDEEPDDTTGWFK